MAMPGTRQKSRSRIFELWRSGWDTLDIAREIGRSEAWVYNHLHRFGPRVRASDRLLCPHCGEPTPMNRNWCVACGKWVPANVLNIGAA